MGRTTPSLKQAVDRYLDRWLLLARRLDKSQGELVKELLEDIDDTLSLFSYVGAVDPLEVLVYHLARKVAELRSGLRERP